jgi:NADH-quinone oxidoreductase subunit N
MISLFPVLWPELLLVVTASALFLLGLSRKPDARRTAPILAAAALGVVFFGVLMSEQSKPITDVLPGATGSTFYISQFAPYVKLIAAGVGVLLVFLSWPEGAEATGNGALEYGHDAGEFFALMLLSICGVFLVAGTNDIILLFLGIELASIPTYIMVSISRPLPIAQEAGVKYFFLGAMAAALMLFGFSYLYGTTGLIKLDAIEHLIATQGPAGLTNWQLLAVIMLLLGFAFKIAAVPLHSYAGDVYQGAATPVTAFLAFVPKTSGMIAIIKILYAAGGGVWAAPEMLVELVWVLAVLTMTFGNVLALMQYNVKRVLAYSSVAHSGYMLVGITTLLAARNYPTIQANALAGVLFYLAAYGIMNVGAFGVLQLLPSRHAHAADLPPTSGTAETYDDLAGQGYRHLALGLAMAISCFSLTGIPFTVGFLGKYVLVKPAWALAQQTSNHILSSHMGWLVVILMVNAAISAGYYLRIIAALFLRSIDAKDGSGEPVPHKSILLTTPAAIGVALSVAATLGFFLYIPAANGLLGRARDAAQIQPKDAVPHQVTVSANAN